MLPPRFWPTKRDRQSLFSGLARQRLACLLGVILLLALICLEFGPLNFLSAHAQNTTLDHTQATVNNSCQHIHFSPDGNPFPLCPSPFPSGGNCTWWSWEQWHLLGYNLPLNWGNAADWIVDAQRAGLAMGKLPRVGAIAVFPRGDGVWAFGPEGHVAFVTSVSADNDTFNVTYQNYGDPTPMHIGIGYSVSIINEPHFQNGQMRFIYFPKIIDTILFSHLSGINGLDPTGVQHANSLLGSGEQVVGGNRIALGLPPSSPDQELSADFTGTGRNDLLLYNRQTGRLAVLILSPVASPEPAKKHLQHAGFGESSDGASSTNSTSPQLVTLVNQQSSDHGWGSSLDIHIGDFTGAGTSEILLYDRVTGTLQLISLTPQLTIKKQITLSGWGPGWEVYVGRFDGQRSGIFLYNRYANPDPAANPTSTPVPTLNPPSNPAVTPTPTAKPHPSPTPKPSPSSTPSPTLSPTPSPTPKPHQDGNGTNLLVDSASYSSLTAMNGYLDPPPPSNDAPPAGWTTQGRTANALMVNFNKDFTVQHVQPYSFWHNAWEVSIGRFVNAHQDGILLYDRIAGEMHIMSFDSTLQIAYYQRIHNLRGNWEVHSGDFQGSGRAQVLLYDPSSGSGQILTLAHNLSVVSQTSYTGWGINQVLYVGHFGTPTLSVILYDAQAGHTTFLAFNAALAVVHNYSVPSWDQSWQVLVGSFLDRSHCLGSYNCTAGDDILVLNRQTGQMQQYVFSFGRQFQVVDDRGTAFIRSGVLLDLRMNSIDTTTFNLFTLLETGIHNEELY